jgi:transcription initiation factor TFIID subunit 7
MGPPPVPVRPSITTEGLGAPSSAPSSAGGRSLRKRNTSLSKDSPYTENDDFDSPSERAMRSANRANLKPWTPKLKLKVSSASDNRNQSFLGPYDRELDSEDEDLVFEEQFILRLPPGKDADKLREVVSKRGVSNDIWLKFKGWSRSVDPWQSSDRAFSDSRRAVFHMGENLYPAKLVDLPCIVESQKTLDNKHMFKVSDICQVRSHACAYNVLMIVTTDASGRRIAHPN